MNTCMQIGIVQLEQLQVKCVVTGPLCVVSLSFRDDIHFISRALSPSRPHLCERILSVGIVLLNNK